MTERDAFGNPIAPGPTATAPTPAPAPVPAPASVSPTPPPVTPLGAPFPTIPTYGPTKRSWGGRLLGLAFLMIFLVPLGIGGLVAYNAFHTAKDAIHGVSIKSNVGTPSSPGTGTTAPVTAAPAGVSGGSLLEATNLAKAMAAARQDPGGRLTLLRLAPDRADLQLARRGGGLTLVQLRAGGGQTVIQAPGTPSRTIGFARVDPQAPARLVRRAAHRLGRSTKAIDYLVLVNVLDGPQWSAYFKGGAAFQGDAHGAITRRIQ